jgi:hypothetical protein
MVGIQSTSQSYEEDGLLLKPIEPKGKGVFATREFSAEEEILQFTGKIQDVSVYSDLTHALQVGPREFMSASGRLDDYVNHSCCPNTGVRLVDGRVVLIAIRNIPVGEEISFDYATTQDGGFDSIQECECGVSNCRKFIGDFNCLPEDIKLNYIRLNVVLPHTLKN